MDWLIVDPVPYLPLPSNSRDVKVTTDPLINICLVVTGTPKCAIYGCFL